MSKSKIKTLPELIKQLDTERATKTIGLIAGCFDILHIGHINLFRQAKKQTDILVIELENDQNIKTLKGDDRPVHSLEHRADVLSELSSVDYIFTVEKSFTRDSPEAAEYYGNLISQIKPNYIFTGKKNDKYIDQKKEYAEKAGSALIEIELLNPTSTSEILSKLISME